MEKESKKGKDAIEALRNSHERPVAFKAIASRFDALYQQGTKPGEIIGTAEHVFGRIASEVPRGHVPIYLLGRAYPDVAATAIPELMQSVNSVEERIDATAKAERLGKIIHERTHPVEYKELHGEIFTVSPQVERTIYNAIKYNEQGKRLTVVPMVDLPQIPGEIAVTLEQEGMKWGVELHMKSKEMPSSQAEKENKQAAEYFGISTPESLALQKLEKDIKTENVLRFSLGTIRFCDGPGWKQLQSEVVNEALETLPEAIPEILGNEFAAKKYSQSQMVIAGESGEQYRVGMQQYENKGGGFTVDGVVMTRMSESTMPKVTDDYEQFQRDLQKELKFASGVVSWLYQHARTEPNYKINLQSPDFGLLDWMEGNNLIEQIKNPPNSFTDLGGNLDLRLEVEADAARFIRAYRGEPGVLKPENTILFGESGIGKTAIENGIAAKLIEDDVPVFVLKGDLFAQSMGGNPQESVKELKQMFYYLLMHGGAVMVRDFDALLGSRDNPEANTLIEGVLLSELERVKKDPSTWLVADTQFIGRISEALLNGHRIGNKREIPLETDPQGVEHIITALVRKVDKEIHQRKTPLEFAQVKTQYPFDSSSLAQKIADEGGMIPAQIERIIRHEMQAHEHEGYQLKTESLLTRVDKYKKERAEMEKIKKQQSAERQQLDIAEAVKIAKAALAEVTSLREGIVEKQEGMRRELDDLKNNLGRTGREQEFLGEVVDALSQKMDAFEQHPLFRRAQDTTETE